jgi:hypothetical protein
VSSAGATDADAMEGVAGVAVVAAPEVDGESSSLGRSALATELPRRSDGDTISAVGSFQDLASLNARAARLRLTTPTMTDPTMRAALPFLVTVMRGPPRSPVEKGGADGHVRCRPP